MNIKYGCTTLRAIEKTDFQLLFYLINAPEIEYRTVGWSFPISESTQERWIEKFENSNQSIKLMIELSNGETIGVVMLEDIDWKNRTVSFGCKVIASSKSRMKGDVRDAVKGIITYAFNELGMNCIHGVLQEDNIFSRKLCKKLGFLEEGILRKRVYKGGKYKNLISVSLLKEEFDRRECLK